MNIKYLIFIGLSLFIFFIVTLISSERKIQKSIKLLTKGNAYQQLMLFVSISYVSYAAYEVISSSQLSLVLFFLIVPIFVWLQSEGKNINWKKTVFLYSGLFILNMVLINKNNNLIITSYFLTIISLILYSKTIVNNYPYLNHKSIVKKLNSNILIGLLSSTTFLKFYPFINSYTGINIETINLLILVFIFLILFSLESVFVNIKNQKRLILSIMLLMVNLVIV